MKWNELSDKDKVKLILQHIMPYFDVSDDIVVEDNKIRAPGTRFVNWPIAAWDEAIQLWRIQDLGSKSSEIFDPLHNMGDAWVVYFHAVSKYSYLSDSWDPKESRPFRRFAKVLLGDEDYIYEDELYPGKRLFEIVAQWDAIKICKAALAAYGVEIG
jgi:hypothetical protein